MTGAQVKQAGEGRRGGAWRDYLELTKPRVTGMVLVTTWIGYHLGAAGRVRLWTLLVTLVGTALVAAGTSALNQYLEREADGRMLRTRARPLPAGRLTAAGARLFAWSISLIGLVVLALLVNLLTALLALFTLITYVYVYTPMKRVSSFSTLVGAVPGAIPPLMGWTAACGGIDPGGLALFAILFVWQLPHSLAIGVLYRDDYARGGFALLPVLDARGECVGARRTGGGITGRQILAQALVLLPVSLLPSLVGLTGAVYLVGALLLGIGLAALAVPVALRGTARSARRLVLASVIYLPALLGLMALSAVSPIP